MGNNNFGLKNSPTINIDLVSSSTAFALNFGVINTNSLTKIYSGPFHLEGDMVLEEEWIDENYAETVSVYCYFKADAPRLCLGWYGSRVDGSLAYPVLATEDGGACSCPRDARNVQCNIGEVFQLALVFSKDDSITSILRAGWALQRMMQAAPDGSNAVTNLISDLTNTATTLRTSDQYNAWRRGEAVDGFMPYSQFAAGFKTFGPGVSILSFRLVYEGGGSSLNAQGLMLYSLATSFFNASWNGYNYSAGYTMCTDTIFQPQALQQMALAPPVGVVQPYLSCHPTLSSAFVTAAGIAAANSALVSSIFLVLAVFLTVQYFNTFSTDSSKKVVAPADKALRGAETEMMLLADVNALKEKMLRANDERLALSSRLAAVEALLTRQQLQELSLDGAYAPPPSPLVGFGRDADAFGENPLHRRGARASVVLSSARLSLTGAAPAPADEQISRYDEELRRAQQAAERRHSRFVGSGGGNNSNPP